MANMVKFLEFPNINYELSWYSYLQKKQQYNASVKNESKLRLKDVHDKMFEIIINDLKEWIVRKNENFPDNTILNQSLRGELPTINFIRKSAGKMLERHPRTIRERLKRLEQAGIIKVEFHGSKKPLQIRFAPEIAILFDAKNPNYLPKSKYLTEEQIKKSYDKFFDRKKSNPTTYEKYPTKPDTNYVFPVETVNNNITITKKGVLQKQNTDYYSNNNTSKNIVKTNNTDTFQTKESKQPPFDEEEKKEKSCVKKEKKDISRNEKVRLQCIWTYSTLFYGYLTENLFPDKKDKLSSLYRSETIQYIAENYFSRVTSGEHAARLWEFHYKPRIDLAKKEIHKFPIKYNRKFNRDNFYPKAYLNVTKKGKAYYSFANTYEFIKNQQEWNSLNFWNRELKENPSANKFYRILRDVENQKYDYETALEKVRSINMDTNIFSMLLNASFSGKMFDLYVNTPS